MRKEIKSMGDIHKVLALKETSENLFNCLIGQMKKQKEREDKRSKMIFSKSHSNLVSLEWDPD